MQTMKVFFQYANGNVAIEEIAQDQLAECGILCRHGTFFVFSHFVHGENAVQFDEAKVFHV